MSASNTQRVHVHVLAQPVALQRRAELIDAAAAGRRARLGDRQGTGYTTASSAACTAVDPEAGAATTLLSEVDGTIEGKCRVQATRQRSARSAAGAGCKI